MEGLNSNKLHHAYILEGEKEYLYSSLCSFLEEEANFNTKSNPDFWYEFQDRFNVDNARSLQEMQMKKTKIGNRKIFIFSFNFITNEAQNALLKVLEEPTEGTHIFLITPSAHIFLKTVLSRVIKISIQNKSEKELANKFLESSLKDRLIIIGDLVENIKKEKNSKLDALNFVKAVKEILYLKFKKDRNLEYFKSIKQIVKIENYLYDNGSSIKILLEGLVFIV